MDVTSSELRHLLIMSKTDTCFLAQAVDGLMWKYQVCAQWIEAARNSKWGVEIFAWFFEKLKSLSVYWIKGSPIMIVFAEQYSTNDTTLLKNEAK